MENALHISCLFSSTAQIAARSNTLKEFCEKARQRQDERGGQNHKDQSERLSDCAQPPLPEEPKKAQLGRSTIIAVSRLGAIWQYRLFIGWISLPLGETSVAVGEDISTCSDF